ncbi:condensation domain-containing protein [Paucibacter sp. XJ19-41]|uniref:condensation domain-containing protein n=1 Tax=Paucibacter sp. XJ19-41 TaxID=2927824 RepID=UPI00234938A9|nr:condensation domain-containing protein [Paucibacter sp. XJ19-41]MDC6169757.1 condensation domain-containing protein [Paucibacter sp. XJ19-41]
MPIQQLFFDKVLPRRDHWNQSVLLGCESLLEARALRSALQAVVRHHAALRTAFRQDERGQWSPTVTMHADVPDLLWERHAESQDDVAPLCDAAQRSLSLVDGQVFRALLISLPDGASRLLLTAHHLVVDGVSWRILLEDLRTAYDSAVSGGSGITLPTRTTSYGRWGCRLRAHVEGGAFQKDMAHWRALAGTPAQWPAAYEEGSSATAHATRAAFKLSPALTQQLLKQAPSAYRTQVNDLLLTALARSLCRRRGTGSFLIDLEGHGREDLFDDVDSSRTVGWFTSVFPFRLEAEDDIGDTIRRIKESRATMPHRGLSFGALIQWGAQADREVLTSLPRRDIAFNYLGQFDSQRDVRPDVGANGSRAGDHWWAASESAGRSSDPGSSFSHELTLNGQVIDGVLSMAIDYSAERHDAASVETLLADVQEELLAVIRHCASGVSGVSPSDFPHAALSLATLDDLVSRTGRPAADIEDIYPLTPVQQGMLFDALLEPDSAVNVVQTHALFDHFDIDRLRMAWATVVARHAVLRTGFFWCGTDQPRQIVFRGATLDVERLDWHGRSTAVAEWEALCEQEYRRGFDLGQAPLMRLVVARVDNGHDRLVWTWHHLLMDGWSMSRLLGEVFTLYGGGTLGSVGPAFAEHVAAALRLREDDESYWRSIVGADRQITTLLAGSPLRCLGRQGHAAESLRLDAPSTKRLQAFATVQHVTLNTLVQAAWGLVLGAHTNQETVTFGATMSGRSGELDGIGAVMGLCINTLPIVFTPDPAQTVGDSLRQLLDHNMALRQREQVPLGSIQRWAGQPGQPLFDTLLIFENFPVDQALLQGVGASLRVHELANRGATSSPLTLVVIPGDELLLTFEYALGAFDAPVVADLLRQFIGTLSDLARDAGRSLGQVSVPLPTVDLRRYVRDETLPAMRHEIPRQGSDATRERLHSLWRGILDVASVDDRDNFFELGGDSLAAARLVVAWNTLSALPDPRATLALATVFAHPVLADLARAIDGGHEPEPDHAVGTHSNRASSSRAGPRLFLSPARPWHSGEYRSLLSALQGRHEVMTFAGGAQTRDEVAWAASSVRELAVRQASFIRQQGAGRPCCLLGWSVGGLVALETARLLRNHVPVAWVGLVDPSSFPALRAMLAQGRSFLAQEQRMPQEETLGRWLTERSGMSAHWAMLLAGMQTIEREVFLAQVVAAHGPDGIHLPIDGAGQGSAERALWSELNCLRLGAAYPLPDDIQAEIRVWHSESAVEGSAEMVNRYNGRSTLVVGSGHLDVLDSPELHREVLAALDSVALDALHD